jgi:FG-GAP repeat
VPLNPRLAPRNPTRRQRRAGAVRSLLAVALALLSVLAVASPASALEQQIGVAGNDAFGAAVAVQGDTLVVGTFAQLNHAGAAYVYQRAGDVWKQTAKLVPSDSAIGDGFGIAVAIDADTIVVGAPGATVGNAAGQGAVYTFSRTGPPTRSETAKLTVSDGAARDALGQSVAINGDAIVAGAPSVTVGANAQQGAVFTFPSDGPPARTETAKLTASDGVSGAQLGASVAIEGDTIVAGAPDVSVDATPGAAYTFGRTGANPRTETAKLTA